MVRFTLISIVKSRKSTERGEFTKSEYVNSNCWASIQASRCWKSRNSIHVHCHSIMQSSTYPRNHRTLSQFSTTGASEVCRRILAALVPRVSPIDKEDFFLYILSPILKYLFMKTLFHSNTLSRKHVFPQTPIPHESKWGSGGLGRPAKKKHPIFTFSKSHF